MFKFAQLLRQVTASKVLINGATVPARPCRDASRVTPAYTSKMLHTSLQLGEPLVAHARQQTNVELEIRANSLCSSGAVPSGLCSLLHSVRGDFEGSAPFLQQRELLVVSGPIRTHEDEG